MMPPFDAALYRWEQEYFFEYLVEDFLGQDASALRKNPDFADLAERLGTVARHLVHRDFQSQNLLVKDGEVWLIDFQGLRRGRQQYDENSTRHIAADYIRNIRSPRALDRCR